MMAVSLTLVLIAQLLATAGAEEVLFAEEGGKVTLKSVGVDASMYLYWKHDKHAEDLAYHHPLNGWSLTSDKSLQSRLSVSDVGLTVKQIQKEDFGTFTLSQFSGLGKRAIVNSFKLISVNVSKTGGSLLLPGESLTLTCVVDTPQGYGAPETYWLNPQGKKNGNARGGKLTKSVTHQDNGRWSCVVVNSEKEHKAQISVTVFDLAPPAVRSQYTSEISPLTIPCSFNVSWEQVKAKGVQEVHWHYLPKGVAPTGQSQRLFYLSLDEPLSWKADKGRGLSPAPDPSKGNLSLTRKRGRVEDRGDYVCTFRFKGGVTLKRTVQVQVLQITSSPGTELVSGQSVNLTCGLGHTLASDLHLKWVPPERSSLQPRKSANFFIPDVASGQSGKWGCELWRNNARLTSAVITLKIEPKLSVWMLGTISGAIAIGVLLLALVFIIYRRRNRKRRLPRPRLCQCKNPKPKGFYRT